MSTDAEEVGAAPSRAGRLMPEAGRRETPGRGHHGVLPLLQAAAVLLFALFLSDIIF